MMLLVRLLCAAAIAGRCAAEFDQVAVLTQTPQCALTCTFKVLADASCSLANITNCLCANITLQKAVATCVFLGCNQADQQKASAVRQDIICKGFPQPSKWSQARRFGIVLPSIAFPVVALRFISRTVIAKKIWWDDWCILIATIFLIPITALHFNHGGEGFGLHFWDVRPERVVTLRKSYYASQTIYVVILSVSKLSLLFLYLRIFPDKRFRRFVHYCMAFLAVHGTVYVFCVIFQCVPVSAIWTLGPGRCVDYKALVYSGAGITIFEDVFIVLIPIHELTKLSMSWKRKVAIVFMFAVGGFTIIISIIRLRYIAKFRNSLDITWDNVDVVIWSEMEMFTSVIFASLICIRPLLKKLIPAQFRSQSSKGSQQSSTLQSKSRFSQRISAIFAYRLHPAPRTSGHVKLDESSTKGSVDKRSDLESRTSADRHSSVAVWVTNEASVESGHVELSDLSKDRDDLTPNLKARTTIEAGTTPPNENAQRDLERG